MAKKRMFSLDVVDLDSFIEMPVSAKLLYYDLGMRADDDGFVGNPKKITLLAGCNKEDIETLIKNKFIYMFSSGVIAIRHWNVNNQIRKDRYNETFRIDEKRLLKLENNVYELKDNSGIPNDIPTVTTVKYSIDKNSTDKVSIVEIDSEQVATPSKRFQKPTIEEIKAYCQERGNNIDAEQFFNFYDSKGWKVGNQPMKNWKAAVITWEKRQNANPQNVENKSGNVFLDVAKNKGLF